MPQNLDPWPRQAALLTSMVGMQGEHAGTMRRFTARGRGHGLADSGSFLVLEVAVRDLQEEVLVGLGLREVRSGLGAGGGEMLVTVHWLQMSWEIGPNVDW